MKEEYTTPIMKIYEFEAEDVIMTSGGGASGDCPKTGCGCGCGCPYCG